MKDIKEKGLIGATTDAVSGYVDSVKEAFKEGGINDGISKLSNDLKSFGTGLLGLGGLAGGGILLGNLLSGGGGLIGKIAGKLGKGFKAHAGKLAVMAGLLIGLPMLGEALMGEGGTLLGAIAGALGVGFTVLGGSMIGIAAGLTMVGGAALGKAMTGDNEGGLIGLIASAVGLGTVLVAGGGLALAIPVALTSVVIGAGMKNAVDQLVEDTGGVHNPPVPVEEVNKWARSSIYGEDNARSTTTPVMSDMLNSSILSVSAYDSGEAVSKRMAEGFSTNFPAQWAEISKLVDEHMSLTEPLTKLNTEAKNALVEGEDSFKGSVEKATESTLVMKEGLVSAPVEFRRLGHDAFYGPQGFISQGIDPATRKVNSLINMMNTTIVTRWRIEKEVVDVSD